MKINYPNKIQDSFTILNEQHKNFIFKLCDQQQIRYKDISERFKYPVEVIRIKQQYYDFLSFGWENN